MSFGSWPRYVPVAERKRAATRELAKMGTKADLVVIEGRAIATSSWGKAWCRNLEAYSDYSNRLGRGRTYVRSGAVVDLRIEPGAIQAKVRGSSLYRTTVAVTPMPAATWSRLCADCAGSIDSLVELLQGRIASSIMTRLCRPTDGIFPASKEIRFDCSCPDGADMCKHVAAVLYGIGSRLDRQPELLFTLRSVDAAELLTQTGSILAAESGPGERVLESEDLGALFGVDLGIEEAPLPSSIPARASSGVPSAPRKIHPSPLPARKRKSSQVISSPRDLILARVRQAGYIENAMAREATGLSAHEVRLVLKALVAEGKLRSAGQGRGTTYHAC